jgi:hypothetical protein
MVFGVRHLTEKECKGGVLAAILGSSAWVQTPRAVLAVVRDPANSALPIVARDASTFSSSTTATN